jgi:hypothetical protein
MDPVIEVAGLDAHGVTFVSPADPAFDARATELLGRLAPRALALKPHLVIVENRTPRTIVAFTTTWVSLMKDGRTNTHRCHTKCPDAVCGTGLARTASNEKEIKPGGETIVARACVVAGDALEYDDGQWLAPIVKDKDAEIGETNHLRIELDAVIFDDGEMIGPDHAGLGEAFTTCVAMKQHVYRTLVDRLESCSASEDFFEPVRAMLVPPDRLPRDRREMFRAIYQNEAAAEAISVQRHSLLNLFRPAIRTAPFVVRRGPIA